VAQAVENPKQMAEIDQLEQQCQQLELMAESDQLEQTAEVEQLEQQCQQLELMAESEQLEQTAEVELHRPHHSV
jgi:hypothetical protein